MRGHGVNLESGMSKTFLQPHFCISGMRRENIRRVSWQTERMVRKREERKDVRAIFVTNDLPQSLYTVAGTAVGGERLWTVAIITSKPHWGVGKFLLTCVR